GFTAPDGALSIHGAQWPPLPDADGVVMVAGQGHEDVMVRRAHDASDPLERFVVAQEGVYERALAELRAGRKRSHWMWFVFPQLRGLGRSAQSAFYGIRGLDEARRYLAHPLLGPRLEVATRCVLEAG